jgi:hypothetical protein
MTDKTQHALRRRPGLKKPARAAPRQKIRARKLDTKEASAVKTIYRATRGSQDGKSLWTHSGGVRFDFRPGVILHCND